MHEVASIVKLDQGVEPELSAPLLPAKPSVTLKFEGIEQDLRLVEVIFRNHLGSFVSKAGRTTQPGEGSFLWTTAVRGLSCLLVRCLRSTVDATFHDAQLAGGVDSAASSLDLAIGKGAQLVWLRDMFGTDASGDTFAKRVFTRRNSYRKNRSQPVIVFVNGNYLAPSSIQIFRDGQIANDPSTLERLDEELGRLLVRSTVTEEVSSIIPPPGATFYDRYRQLWLTDLLPRQKVAASRQLLGTAMPRPYIYLLYSVRLSIEEVGDANLEFELVICNCGLRPLTRHQHEFRFEHPQPVPLHIDVSEGNNILIVHDLPHHKFFFVEFPKPLEPGDVWRYRFRIVGSRMFRSDHYWDFGVSTITNQILFHLTHAKHGKLKFQTMEIVSDAPPNEALQPRPVVVEWEGGVAIQWQVPFPEVGSVYRVRWDFERKEESGL